jgi:hypothetical protein
MAIIVENVSSRFSLLVVVVVAVIFPVIIIVNLAQRILSNVGLPASLPWAGVPEGGGPIGRARANLRSLFNMKSLLEDGYNTVSLLTSVSSAAH